MSRSIDVDTKTFIRFWLVILAFAVLALFVWKALTGLIIVGISIFLAIAIKPLGDKLSRIGKKHRKPSTKYSVFAYLIVMLVLLGVVAVVGPVVVTETSKFIGDLPTIFENTIGGWDGINSFGQSIGINDLQAQIMTTLEGFSAGISGNIGNLVMSSVGTIGNVVTAIAFTLILTLFFMIEGPGLMKEFWQTIDNKREDPVIREAQHILSRMADVVSTYVSRQVFVAVIDGCVTALSTFILALIFGFSGNLAIPLGLVTMTFYLIPMFGQFIGCALVATLLFFSNPIAALVFIVFYLIYAQIENNVIAPKIQGKGLGLPPLIILVAIIIGTYMFGLLGAIISVPIAGCIKVLIEEYPHIREAKVAQGEV